MYKLVFTALIILLFAGCSTKSVLVSPTASLRFVGENVHVNVTGQTITQRVLDQLTREIKGQLIIAGFNIDNKDTKSINLKVQVTEFTPGNAALRLTIGFGTGPGFSCLLSRIHRPGRKNFGKNEWRGEVYRVRNWL